MTAPAALDLAAPRTRRTCAILIAVAIILGAGLRTAAYLSRPSYWNDEAAIVVNLTRRDCRELTAPLEYAQAAPPLFLWIERGLLKAFAPSEYALRSFPFALSLATLPLFALLAWRRLPPTGAVWAVAFLAFSDKAIGAGNEVKQYSGDVFVTVALLLAAGGANDGRRLLRAAFVAAVGLWLSFPTVFIFAAISLLRSGPLSRYAGGGLGWGRSSIHHSPFTIHHSSPPPTPALPRGTGRRGKTDGISISIANAIVLASFAALYATVLRKGHPRSLDGFWAASFPDWHHPIRWLARALYGLASHPIDSFGFLTLPFVLLGLVALAKRARWQTFALLPAALLFAFVAAALHRYPFVGDNRLSLYLLPILLLLLGAAAEPQDLALRGPLLRWYWLLIAPLLAISMTHAVKHLFVPDESSTIRPVVDYVRVHRKPDEPIVLAGDSTDPAAPATGRNVEFLCYWPHPPGKVIEKFVTAREVGASRFWVVYSLRRPRGKDNIAARLPVSLGDVRVVQAYQVHEQSGAILVERQP